MKNGISYRVLILYSLVLLTLVMALVSYYSMYSVMLDTSPSSQGWAEFFTIIAAFTAMLGGLTISTLKNFNKVVVYMFILIYFSLITVPLCFYGSHMAEPIIFTGIFLIAIAVLIYLKVFNINLLLSINSILFTLNLAWLIFTIYLL
jgi:hypothetical protein